MHALGVRVLRIRSRILGPIYYFVQSTHVRRALRSFVTSVSGPRSSPDPVRFCAWCASSARHRSDSATFCVQDLSDFYPITGRRLMQNFPLSTLPPPRSPRSPIHVVIPPSTTTPLRSLDVLSARGERVHPRVSCLGSCEASQWASEAFILVIGPRQTVSPHPPPTSSALIGSLGVLLC
jgi:hypothetical protein